MAQVNFTKMVNENYKVVESGLLAQGYRKVHVHGDTHLYEKAGQPTMAIVRRLGSANCAAKPANTL